VKFTKILLAFGAFALAVASAASTYTVTLTDVTYVNGSALKPGDYKMQIAGDKITLKSGKTVVEVPAKVQDAAQKFDGTALKFENANGATKLQEIWVGGTHTKIVLQPTTSAAGEE